MPRTDFVYYASFSNNAWGSYKEKNGQTLEQIVNAIRAIGAHEHLQVVDLYHEKAFELNKLVAYKRLKDPATGQYKNYVYPDYIGVPFNPDADEYPYPVDAIRMTYDGLHPSDEGYALIAKKLVKALRK
jgi:lysophospholipase L1-like esterase